MEVEYPLIVRPGLAAPLTVEIRDPQGFSGPIHVSLPTAYLQAYDENEVHPAPDTATVDAERTRWRFDPPEGDTFQVWFDQRVEPGAQWRHEGDVVVEAAGRQVRTSFTTWILP